MTSSRREKKMIQKNTMSIAISFLSLALLVAGCSGDLGRKKHTKGPVTVIEVGDCGGGEGLFSGPRECAIKVRWGNGSIEYSKTIDKVMAGQELFRECWIESGESRCFSNFTASPRSMYK